MVWTSFPVSCNTDFQDRLDKFCKGKNRSKYITDLITKDLDREEEEARENLFTTKWIKESVFPVLKDILKEYDWGDLTLLKRPSEVGRRHKLCLKLKEHNLTVNDENFITALYEVMNDRIR